MRSKSEFSIIFYFCLLKVFVRKEKKYRNQKTTRQIFNTKIEFIWDSEVTNFNGNEDLESIDLVNKKDNK